MTEFIEVPIPKSDKPTEGTADNEILRLYTPPPRRYGRGPRPSLVVLIIMVGVVVAATFYWYSGGLASAVANMTNPQNPGGAALPIKISDISASYDYYTNFTNEYNTTSWPENYTISRPGEDLAAGQALKVALWAYNGQVIYPYEITSVQTNTSGFSIINESRALPYIVLPGVNTSFYVYLATPDSYNGAVRLLLKGAGIQTEPKADWAEDIGLALTQNSTSIAYTVPALPQQDSDGCGPAYLVGGKTNTGYYYQTGITYDWCNQKGRPYSGFTMIYNVFWPNGTMMKSGFFDINGGMHYNDTVLLNLSIVAGNVIMSVKDVTDSASQSFSYPSNGSTYFKGQTFAPSYGGLYSGAETEWYHLNAVYGAAESAVKYSPVSNERASQGWLFVSEGYSGASRPIFWGSTSGTSAPSNQYELGLNGVYGNYSAGGSFITG